MIVCERCLVEIESHEGKQIKKECEERDTKVVFGDYDDDGNFVENEYGSEKCVWCEWCEEYHTIADCWVI